MADATTPVSNPPPMPTQASTSASDNDGWDDEASKELEEGVDEALAADPTVGMQAQILELQASLNAEKQAREEDSSTIKRQDEWLASASSTYSKLKSSAEEMEKELRSTNEQLRSDNEQLRAQAGQLHSEGRKITTAHEELTRSSLATENALRGQVSQLISDNEQLRSEVQRTVAAQNELIRSASANEKALNDRVNDLEEACKKAKSTKPTITRRTDSGVGKRSHTFRTAWLRSFKRHSLLLSREKRTSSALQAKFEDVTSDMGVLQARLAVLEQRARVGELEGGLAEAKVSEASVEAEDEDAVDATPNVAVDVPFQPGWNSIAPFVEDFIYPSGEESEDDEEQHLGSTVASKIAEPAFEAEPALSRDVKIPGTFDAAHWSPAEANVDGTLKMSVHGGGTSNGTMAVEGLVNGVSDNAGTRVEHEGWQAGEEAISIPPTSSLFRSLRAHLPSSTWVLAIILAILVFCGYELVLLVVMMKGWVEQAWDDLFAQYVVGFLIVATIWWFMN